MPFVQNQCGYCGGSMRITQLACEECEFTHGGDFHTPRLYRLEPEDQQFVELFMLASGSLKQMAKLLGVSYPTVRNRLDRLIERLETEKRADEQRKQRILADIEAERISVKLGTRMIDAI